MLLPEDSMAHFLSAARAKPDRNFVKRLEYQLLGEREHNLRPAFWWLTVPALATAVLLVGVLWQSPNINTQIDKDTEELNQLEQELNNLDQSSNFTLEQIRGQLEID